MPWVPWVGAPVSGVGAPVSGVGAPALGVGAPAFGVCAPAFGVCAPASVDGTARPNATATPRSENILRRETISHSILSVISTSWISMTAPAAARRCLIRLCPRCPLLRRSSRLSGLCVHNRDRPLRLIRHSPDFRAAAAPASFLCGFWATANRVSETSLKGGVRGCGDYLRKPWTVTFRTRSHSVPQSQHDTRAPWPIAGFSIRLGAHRCRAWPPRRS